MSRFITKRDIGIHYELCPFCGTELQGTYCSECNTVYTLEALEHQELWACLSESLAETSEESPLICGITIELEGTFGMSTLEMLEVDKIFQHSDGTMWYHIYGTPAEDWQDLDECTNDILKQILDGVDETLRRGFSTGI